MTEATDEEVEELIRHFKGECSRYVYGFCHTLACLKRGGHPTRPGTPVCIASRTVDALARLKRVERELAQTEKECENALAALAGEPYPYPEVRRKK